MESLETNVHQMLEKILKKNAIPEAFEASSSARGCLGLILGRTDLTNPIGTEDEFDYISPEYRPIVMELRNKYRPLLRLWSLSNSDRIRRSWYRR